MNLSTVLLQRPRRLTERERRARKAFDEGSTDSVDAAKEFNARERERVEQLTGVKVDANGHLLHPRGR
jgi:hypothetical protein